MSVGPQEQAPSESASSPATCDLDATPLGEVRRLVREALSGRDDIKADDAVLVADELASNARRHGAAPRSCSVVLLDNGRLLRVEVDDASPLLPQARTPDHTGGRGLVLIDRLASVWGVHAYDDHKTVWAELALDGPASNGGNAPHLAAAPEGPHPSTLQPPRQPRG